MPIESNKDSYLKPIMAPSAGYRKPLIDN